MVIEIVIEKQKFKVIVIDYFTPVIATTLLYTTNEIYCQTREIMDHCTLSTMTLTVAEQFAGGIVLAIIGFLYLMFDNHICSMLCHEISTVKIYC